MRKFFEVVEEAFDTIGCLAIALSPALVIGAIIYVTAFYSATN